eukprot:768637-Hanusia_phi.AAC.5
MSWSRISHRSRSSPSASSYLSDLRRYAASSAVRGGNLPHYPVRLSSQGDRLNRQVTQQQQQQQQMFEAAELF